MTRKTARDFDPAVLKLFDQYVHGQLSRRGFVQSAGKLAAGVAAAVLAWQRSLDFFNQHLRS
jgi:carboxymethylenebutenolidase